MIMTSSVLSVLPTGLHVLLFVHNVLVRCGRLVKFDVPSSAIPFHNGRHASSCVREAVAKETVWSTKAPSLSSPSPLLANIWRPLPPSSTANSGKKYDPMQMPVTLPERVKADGEHSQSAREILL